MVEVQVYEGTVNSPRYLEPGQVETFGRNLMGFSKRVMVFAAKQRDPTIVASLRRYSGQFLEIGMKISKGIWNEEEVNHLPLLLGQTGGHGFRLGQKSIANESILLHNSLNLIVEIKRDHA